MIANEGADEGSTVLLEQTEIDEEVARVAAEAVRRKRLTWRGRSDVRFDARDTATAPAHTDA